MDGKKPNGSGNGSKGSNEWRVKVGLAEMLKGGVIMDVTNAEQAKIAENAGACAVMALERVPSDIRKEGGVARMASIKVIREIMNTVTIPVMAKVRIGHFAEAEVLQALEVDFIDESEVLTPADEENHIWKRDYRVPFVCGARNLGEALRRIAEGAAMIRTKGEAGSGNVVEAVRHMRAIMSQMKELATMREDELMHEASFFIWLMIARMCRTASTTFPDPASPFVRIIAAPSAMRRSASPRLRAPQTNGTR